MSELIDIELKELLNKTIVIGSFPELPLLKFTEFFIKKYLNYDIKLEFKTDDVGFRTPYCKISDLLIVYLNLEENEEGLYSRHEITRNFFNKLLNFISRHKFSFKYFILLVRIKIHTQGDGIISFRQALPINFEDYLLSAVFLTYPPYAIKSPDDVFLSISAQKLNYISSNVVILDYYSIIDNNLIRVGNYTIHWQKDKKIEGDIIYE